MFWPTQVQNLTFTLRHRHLFAMNCLFNFKRQQRHCVVSTAIHQVQRRDVKQTFWSYFGSCLVERNIILSSQTDWQLASISLNWYLLHMGQQAVQYITVQCTTVQHPIVHYSTLHYSTLHYGTVHYSTLSYSTLQHSIHYSTVGQHYKPNWLTACMIN